MSFAFLLLSSLYYGQRTVSRTSNFHPSVKDLLLSSAEDNPYTVLGVPGDATADQIRKAYRRKARTAHPDHGGSDEDFHEVSEAYRLLSDVSLRRNVDRQFKQDQGSTTTPGTTRSTPRDTTAAAYRSRATTTASPSRKAPVSFGSTPLFRPPLTPGTPPLLPLSIAGRQSHSSPRKPGLLKRLGPSASARNDAEERTVRLLETNLLQDYPAGRLVNGIRFDDGTEAGSVLLGGYRVAVVESLLASAHAYRWDGTRLLLKGRPVGGPGLRRTVRSVQERLPGCHVTGWLVLHNLQGNPFEPVIDYPPGADRSSLAPVHAVNSGTLARQVRQFMSSGPQRDVVQLPVLAQLLEASS